MKMNKNRFIKKYHTQLNQIIKKYWTSVMNGRGTTTLSNKSQRQLKGNIILIELEYFNI